ncbi:MAG: TIGR03960 family B12-binding radical SAM protein [Deltaproteobacteria bacterium]
MLDAPDYTAILSVLARAKRPSRYLGTETNARRKAWQDASLRVCLIFPDLYEIGMSHLGLHILYHILNELPWAMADRAYCPAPDLEDVLRQKAIPIWGLESGRPLGQFDILAITLPYELSASNILTILDLAGVPLRSRDRKDPSLPLVLGGGSSASNPEPVAPFFDAILIGDGEEAIVEIAEAVRDGRTEGVPKRELLHALSRIEGIYVPEFSDVRYGPDGSFREMVPLEPGAGPVRRRIVSDLAKVPFPDRPLVPFAPIVHDRLGVEIARGCTRGCRFCQAGILYRPVRERPPGLVLDLMERGLRASGFEEASFLSLSTGDYRCIEPVLAQVMARHQEDRVSVSLPSLRVGTLTPEIMELVGKVRKTGFTLAPEAGSERLRKVINKGITEEELLATSERIFGLGWPGIKLYFMIGLPTETREDCLAIAELARKVLKTGERGKTVTVSVGTFVPKPHTPFQWERQITVHEARERFELIRSAIRERAIKFKWHDPELSFLEGVFSRGDRRLASLVERAWRLGARLDAWSDHFRPDLYRRAADEMGLDLDALLEARLVDAPLPWDHIDTRITKAFLLAERENAYRELPTADCRHGACQGCGVCDFRHLRPVTHAECDLGPMLHREVRPKAGCHRLRFVFEKLGPARLLGHLEVMHVFHRAARRAGLPVVFSQGHHPLPRFSFGQPIPLGTESLCEEMEILLEEDWRAERVMEAMNSQLPQGLRIVSGISSSAGGGLNSASEITFIVCLSGIGPSEAQKAIGAFRSLSNGKLAIRRKGRERMADLDQAVTRLEVIQTETITSKTAVLSWIREAQKGTAPPACLVALSLSQAVTPMPKPVEVMEAIFPVLGPNPDLRILKIPAWPV